AVIGTSTIGVLLRDGKKWWGNIFHTDRSGLLAAIGIFHQNIVGTGRGHRKTGGPGIGWTKGTPIHTEAIRSGPSPSIKVHIHRRGPTAKTVLGRRRDPYGKYSPTDGYGVSVDVLGDHHLTFVLHTDG